MSEFLEVLRSQVAQRGQDQRAATAAARQDQQNAEQRRQFNLQQGVRQQQADEQRRQFDLQQGARQQEAARTRATQEQEQGQARVDASRNKANLMEDKSRVQGAMAGDFSITPGAFSAGGLDLTPEDQEGLQRAQEDNVAKLREAQQRLSGVQNSADFDARVAQMQNEGLFQPDDVDPQFLKFENIGALRQALRAAIAQGTPEVEGALVDAAAERGNSIGYGESGSLEENPIRYGGQPPSQPQAPADQGTPTPPAPTGQEVPDPYAAIPGETLAGRNRRISALDADAEDARRNRNLITTENTKREIELSHAAVENARSDLQAFAFKDPLVRTALDNLMDGLLSDTGLGAGFMSDVSRRVNRFMGGDTAKNRAEDNLASMQSLEALNLRNPDGPAGGMPGSLSEGELQFLREAVVGLEKTPLFNFKALSLLASLTDAKQAQVDFLQEWQRRNPGSGGVPESVRTQAEDSMNDVFERSRYDLLRRAFGGPDETIANFAMKELVRIADTTSEGPLKSWMEGQMDDIVSPGGAQ